MYQFGKLLLVSSVDMTSVCITAESEVLVRHSNICQTARKAKLCLSYRLQKLYKIADAQVVAVIRFCSSCLRISFYCLLRRHWLNFRVLIYIT
jgi:hypothetical protein